MKTPPQMLHLPSPVDSGDTDHTEIPIRMREFHHRPSLDSISELNDDYNNNYSDKTTQSSINNPIITVTNCDEDGNYGKIDNNFRSFEHISTSPRNSLTGSDSDLSRLKVTAMKLKLGTRRASYVEWREKYLDRPKRRPSKPDLTTDIDENGNGSDKLTTERKDRINNALEWLRTELVRIYTI